MGAFAFPYLVPSVHGHPLVLHFAPSISSTSPTLSHKWEELLTEKDVIVLTKATFFRTVTLLFQFAQAPGRQSWEFFSYRGWEYIFGTWCATIDIAASALSCGAQHPFIDLDGDTLHYALPDYVLLSLGSDAEGKQEAWLVLVVEIKALPRADPDTEGGRKDALGTFIKTWKQRTSQARLALQNHPTQQEVQIVMISGPWFAPYTYQRSQLIPEPAPRGAQSLPPPRKKWRRLRGAFHVDDSPERKGELTVKPTNAQNDAEQTVPIENRDQEGYALRQGRGKRKRDAELNADPHITTPIVNHVFQLGPNGERNAMNPWFLRLLGKMKKNLERFRGTLRTQNSWFDWPMETVPDGDGHAEGFILPAAGRLVPGLEVDDVLEVEDVNNIVRLDEDSTLVSVPSTPGNQRDTLSMMQLNALLSPKIHRAPRVSGGGSNITPGDSSIPHGRTEGALPAQHPETQPGDLDSEADDATTPKAHRGPSPSQGLSSRSNARELSPSAARLKRRQHGPLNPPQFYPAPCDSSPPHFTPHILWPRADDERNSESLAGYDAGTPDSAAIPRPASAPPTPSSPPSGTSESYRLTAADSVVSRGDPLRPRDRSRQDRASRPLRGIPPSRSHRPHGALYRGPPMRRLTHEMSNLQLDNTPRDWATVEEWQREPATKDELLMLALKAGPGAGGKTDLMHAYRKAGMNEQQATLASWQQLGSVHAVNQSGTGPRSPGGPSTATSSGRTTATFAVPPLSIQRPSAMDTSSKGEGRSHQLRAGVATGPSTTYPGLGARPSGSRPPSVDGTSVERTTGLDEGDSESSNDLLADVPYSAAIPRPASAPPVPSSPPSPSQDFKAADSGDHRTEGRPREDHSNSSGRIQCSESRSEAPRGTRDQPPGTFEPTGGARTSWLTAGIGNLRVDEAFGNAGDPKWDNLSLPTLYFLGEMARKDKKDVRQAFRDAGMNERQVEEAYEQYKLHVRDKWTDRDLLHALLASDGIASTRPNATLAAFPNEGQRRATTRREAHSLPGPFHQDQDDPANPQVFGLPGTNPHPGPSSTNTSMKGKERQG